MNSLLVNLSALIGQGLAYSKFYLFHVACMFSVPSLIKNLKGKKLADYSKIAPLVFMLLLMVTSLLWSDFRKAGALEILQFALGLYVLFFNKTLSTRKYDLEKAILLIVGVDILICLAESFELFRWPFSQYSELASLFKRSSSNWYPMRTDVPTGLHWNPNINSFFLLIFSPVVVTALKDWWKKLLYLFICSFVFYKTGSKTLLVGWVVFLAAIALIQLRSSKLDIKKVSAVLVGIVLFIVICLQFSQNSFQNERYSRILSSLKSYSEFVPEMIYRRFTGQEVEFDYISRDSSLHERFTMLDGLLKVIASHPIRGVGAGGLSESLHTQAGVTNAINTPHFYFLEVWAKYGLCFLVTYLGWFFWLLGKVWKSKNICWLSMGLFFIFSPVVSSLMYFLPKWVLYSYALAVTDQESSGPDLHV